MGAFVNGFESALGSFGAMALFGVVALIGIWLVVTSKRSDGSRNTVTFGLGIGLLVIASLPYLPLLGISVLADSIVD